MKGCCYGSLLMGGRAVKGWEEEGKGRNTGHVWGMGLCQSAEGQCAFRHLRSGEAFIGWAGAIWCLEWFLTSKGQSGHNW